MPNYIKYGPTDKISITKNINFNIGVFDLDSYGPTSETGFWNGVTPPVGGYTIYVNKDSQGPSIHVAYNDIECINKLLKMGATGTTIGDVLAWSTGRTDIWVQTQEITQSDVLNLSPTIRISSNYSRGSILATYIATSDNVLDKDLTVSFDDVIGVISGETITNEVVITILKGELIGVTHIVQNDNYDRLNETSTIINTSINYDGIFTLQQEILPPSFSKFVNISTDCGECACHNPNYGTVELPVDVTNLDMATFMGTFNFLPDWIYFNYHQTFWASATISGFSYYREYVYYHPYYIVPVGNTMVCPPAPTPVPTSTPTVTPTPTMIGGPTFTPTPTPTITPTPLPVFEDYVFLVQISKKLVMDII
jgi:hypothetical protein